MKIKLKITVKMLLNILTSSKIYLPQEILYKNKMEMTNKKRRKTLKKSLMKMDNKKIMKNKKRKKTSNSDI